MLPPRAAAAGPFLEERTGTQELFRNRSLQPGHEVFLVRDEPTGDVLLIHSLAIDAAASPESRNAVVAAARQALNFRHPAVLPVLRVEGTEQSLILAQSFPGGVLLRDHVFQHGPFSSTQALQIMRLFADALQHAETLGLTLSQISPQDFIVGNAPAGQDLPAVFCLCPPVPRGWWLEVADPSHASPEQRHRQPCNALSALYSAGALLAYMLTGRQPARGEDWPGWLESQHFAPSVKAALTAVLEEYPARRSQGPAAWIQLLERAQARPQPTGTLSELAAKARSRAPSAPHGPPSLPVPRQTTPTPRISKSRWLDALALGAVVCVGFVLTWQARRSAELSAATRRAAQDTLSAPVATPVGMPLSPSPPEPAPTVPLIPTEPAPNIAVIAPLREPSLAGNSSTPPASAPASQPPAPPPADTVSVRHAQVLTVEDELLQDARQAPSERQAELYRQVLKKAPNNREALHGVVEDALADFPQDETRLRDLRRWTSALENTDDPLGDYARGRLLLEDAKKASNLPSAAESLTAAVTHLEQAVRRDYQRAWFLLLQGLVNLHNVQQQAGNVRQAARTERMLFEKIDALPPTVPAIDTRLLAERLEQLMAERTAKGRPHPQADFLRRVVQRLQHVASQRDGAVSQAP